MNGVVDAERYAELLELRDATDDPHDRAQFEAELFIMDEERSGPDRRAEKVRDEVVPLCSNDDVELRNVA